VIAIDTSALIAIFRLEPEAESFLKAIAAARVRYISALSVLEASMVMSGRGGDTAMFEPLDEFLEEARAEAVPFDAVQMRLARTAFVRFGKGRHKAALNFGDCASYAVAVSMGVPLLFKGTAFECTDIKPAAGPPH
jgi:ribonuclease VapC